MWKSRSSPPISGVTDPTTRTPCPGASQNYPRKIGKTLGIKKLLKEIKNETDLIDLNAAIQNYKKLCISNQTEPQFIKHFSTFASCWRDYLEVETSNQIKKTDAVVMDLVDGQLVPRQE